MKIFLDFLERASACLERFTKPMERKMAYFWCWVLIVVCLMAICMAIAFFVYNFIGQTALEVRVALILSGIVVISVLGLYVYLLITRDLKHFRTQKPKKKEDAAKKRKIEF